MDIAAKEFLEKKEKNELINIILDIEESERRIQNIRQVEAEKFKEREKTIEVLLETIKYLTGGNK